jgi:hypothetical protein
MVSLETASGKVRDGYLCALREPRLLLGSG